MTYTFRAPEVLEESWLAGEENDPDTEMRPAFREDLDELRALVEAGEPLVPVEGRVSDWKSWMAVCFAQEAAEDGMEVTVFAPQTANRETAVDRLVMFGAEYLEHAGRIDHCIWDEWREEVGRVDKKTCSEIPCRFHLDNQPDIDDRAEDGLAAHLFERGMRVELDSAAIREMGREENQFACPEQLYRAVRRMGQTDRAVNVATYAKAFADAAIAEDDPLDSDVAVLDEAHTVATDMERVVEPVEPGELRGAVDAVSSYLEEEPRAWAGRAMNDLAEFSSALGAWLRRSEQERVSPDGLFSGRPVSLSSSFDLLDRVDGRLMQTISGRAARGDWGSVRERAVVYNATERLRGLLSHLNLYNEGAADFVHSRYQEGGERVNSMAFRRVDESVDPAAGTTPQAVYDAWEERGTHPAIAERWGTILDRHIEALWSGRAVYPGGDRPGAPVTPLGEVRRISGADTLVTLSATHSDLSDPTRDPDRARETRHDLVCMPVYLRADGCESERFVGNRAADPETPWFRRLVERAKEESGEELAAVPINSRNAAGWAGGPVARLGADGSAFDWGVVPNSRGSLGEKDLESLGVGAVLCGVQAQTPASTARRLVLAWETLAPRRPDPAAVLEESWRLLAQHVVSGTIQAGGRFAWDATNAVFERPALFELAGFEASVAGPDTPGFAGAFVRAFEEEKAAWEDRRDAVRAKRAVRYLEETDRKSPTPAQVAGEFRRVYGGGAEAALRSALRRGEAAAADGGWSSR